MSIRVVVQPVLLLCRIENGSCLSLSDFPLLVFFSLFLLPRSHRASIVFVYRYWNNTAAKAPYAAYRVNEALWNENSPLILISNYTEGKILFQTPLSYTTSTLFRLYITSFFSPPLWLMVGHSVVVIIEIWSDTVCLISTLFPPHLISTSPSFFTLPQAPFRIFPSLTIDSKRVERIGFHSESGTVSDVRRWVNRLMLMRTQRIRWN